MTTDPRFMRVLVLAQAALRPPHGFGRIIVALLFGAICHLLFGLAVLSMMIAMYFGMSESIGAVPWPWAALANVALIAQFPLVHSVLLTGRGSAWLARVIPGPDGATLSTTTYAIIASVQLLMLFALWTPSGIVWWRAEGVLYWVICAAYAASWLLVAKASFDAGVEVQSGALGWLSLLAKIKPIFPDMPTTGLFAVMRQPIYVAFSLTLWTVPFWTPDQLVLAICYTTYCLVAPRLKERRFTKRYGAQFDKYCEAVPYILGKRKGNGAS